MDLSLALTIVITASILSLGVGGILAPKPLVGRMRLLYLYAFFALCALGIICAAALYLEENWKSISSIIGAVVVSIFSLFCANEINKSEQNKEKATRLVFTRTVALVKILSELNVAHGLVSQSRYYMELALADHSDGPTQNTLVLNRFNTLIGRWPNIESVVHIDPSHDAVEFPESHMQFYALWRRAINFFGEFVLIQKEFNSRKQNQLAPKFSTNVLPFDYDSLFSTYNEDEIYFFIALFENYPIKCIAAEESLRKTLIYVKTQYEDLIMGNIDLLVSKRFIIDKGWNRLGISSSGFNFACEWEEIQAYYKTMGLGEVDLGSQPRDR